MKRDFTLGLYKKVLLTFQSQKYYFITLEEYFKNRILSDRLLILRHDVDRLSDNALKIACVEKEMGIKASYYFRYRNDRFNEKIIKKIIALDHEIGYHYEDLTFANGDSKKAIKLFESHLHSLRKLYPVKTICMHGSPLSKWDNGSMWKNFNYKEFGILGDPFFDLDYTDFFYLTDTGRGWNHFKTSLRDHVEMVKKFYFRNTFEIITALHQKQLPKKIIMNTHPNRWNDNIILWSYEFLGQNFKNVLKKILKGVRSTKLGE